jgi:hypothetical protein
MYRSVRPAEMPVKCLVNNSGGSVPEAPQRCNYGGNEDGIREIGNH